MSFELLVERDEIEGVKCSKKEKNIKA